jgi:hypothetical protein
MRWKFVATPTHAVAPEVMTPEGNFLMYFIVSKNATMRVEEHPHTL